MRMYTMFTESHRQMMYDYFLPSLIPNEYLLTIKQFPQLGSGHFMSPGFVETVTLTFDILVDAIDENYGGCFVFSDCDIQFFGPTKSILLEAIADCDLAAQMDGQNIICTGFFVCRASDKMRQVFLECAEWLSTRTHRVGDQDAVNCHRSKFTWKLLDSQQFWCPRRRWRGRGEKLDVPHNILMHHANWTIGIPNKIDMLKQVNQQIQSKGREAGSGSC